MASHFDCSPIKILEYNDEINLLLSKGIVKQEKNISNGFINISENTFKINEKIGEAIIKNKALSEIKEQKIDNIIELLEVIYNLGEQRDDEKISTSELFRETENTLNLHLHIPFVKKIVRMNLESRDQYFYLYLIWQTLNGDESTDISFAVDKMFERASQKIKYVQYLLSENSILIKRKLTEIVNAQFFNDTEMKLSEFSLNLLKEEGIKILLNKKKKKDVIIPENINSKRLFYNAEDAKQISLLKRMVSETEFKKIQKRLAEKKLPKGLTALLYGVPGTGKTETVYQIAKSTNREIIKVDISQSKSMWFGESEKIIKRIFTDYKEYAKECKLMPILLFNEADAIISKRKSVNNSNVAQTENAIQNIILEELENFEGIFFATTNLVSNLDVAFERRFLFKIEFHKPDISVKTKIWKSKLPKLSLSNCKKLASQFNFSGGQIDNIVRKSEVQEIIYGKKTTFDNIIEFCKSEELSKNMKIKIGFD